MLILSLLVLLPLSGAWIFPPYYEGSANDGTEYSCVNFTYEGWLAIQNTPWDFNLLNMSRDISDADSHEKRDFMRKFEAVEVPDSMINDDNTEEIVSFGVVGEATYITDLDYDPENREVEDDVENDPDFIVNRRRKRAIIDVIKEDVQEEKDDSGADEIDDSGAEEIDDSGAEEKDDSGAEELEETENNSTDAYVPGCVTRDEQSFLLKLELEQRGRKDLLYPGQMAQVRLKNLHNKAPITFFISVSAFEEGDEAGAFDETPRLRKVESRRSGCRGVPNHSQEHGHHHSHDHGHHHDSHDHGHHHHSHGHGHHHDSHDDGHHHDSHDHGHHHSHDHGHHHSQDKGHNHTHDSNHTHAGHNVHGHDHSHHHHHESQSSSHNVNHTQDHDISHSHHHTHHNHDHVVSNDKESVEKEDGIQSIAVEGINTDGTGLIDLRLEIIDTLNPVKDKESVESVTENIAEHRRQRELKPVRGEVASCPHVVQGWMEDDSAVEIDYMPPEKGCIVIRAYASYSLNDDGSLIFTSEAYEEYLQVFDCVAPNAIPREDHDSEDYETDSNAVLTDEIVDESTVDDSSLDDDSESSEEGHQYNLRPRNKRNARYIVDKLDQDVSESSEDDSESSEDDSESSEDDSESSEDDSESSEEGHQFNLIPRNKRAADRMTNDFDDNTDFIERQLGRLRRATDTKQERKQRRKERKENKKNRRKDRKNRRRNDANGNTTSDATATGNVRNRQILKNLTDKGERFCCKEGILHKKASTYETEEGTMPVVACDSVPMEVTLWGSHKHSIEVSACEVKYKSCCDAFDLDTWKEWLEQKKERRQRRRRRKNKNKKRRNRGNRNDIN